MHNVAKQIKNLVRPLVPAPIRRRIRRWRKQWVVDHAVRMRQQMSGEDKAAWGVTLIGDTRRGNGLGEAGRTSLKCLRRAGVPTQEVPLSDENLSRMDSPYQIVMIHTNPDQLDQVCQMLPAAQWRGKYVIGDWIWEQETLPDWWVPYFDLFDEIWTPSGFAAGAIRKATKKPVRVLPLAVEPQCDETWNRASFGLPDNLFLCLVAFDYHSVFARKNPDGAIRAFCQAFCDRREQVGLVLKARNTPPEVLAELRHSLRDWPNSHGRIHKDAGEQSDSCGGCLHFAAPGGRLRAGTGRGNVLGHAGCSYKLVWQYGVYEFGCCMHGESAACYAAKE